MWKYCKPRHLKGFPWAFYVGSILFVTQIRSLLVVQSFWNILSSYLKYVFLK
jgi:hypothetical protein